MLNRSDRFVRRARLSIPPAVPAGRLASAMQEGLRLATLPGENEGRSYYFRTIRVTGLPPNGDRTVWLAQFQQALTQAALFAVHGSDSNAAFAPAVYFHSHQEALAILLHRVLARQSADEWYWPAVASSSAPALDSVSTETIRAIVRKLYAQPAAWLAVAAALFAVPRFDVKRLFGAIAAAEAQAWLREIDGEPPPLRTPSIAIAPVALPAIQHAIRLFGTEDARTLWLTTLAVLLESPAAGVSQTAVWQARAELQGRRARQPEFRLVEAAPVPTDAFPVVEIDRPTEQTGRSSPTTDRAAMLEQPSSAAAPEPTPRASPAIVEPTPMGDSVPWHYAGEPTTVAGLFFLLNALQRVGAPQAVAAFAGVVPDFAPRVLLRLMAQAGANPEDCIARWLESHISGPTPEDALPCEPSWWPANLPRHSRETTVDDLVRTWCLGVRRWCWRAGRIAAREVIVRPGVFTVNRTDLDVSLPLERADIRIRLVGLDLDPGWLPWFGLVVRFHYLSGMRP